MYIHEIKRKKNIRKSQIFFRKTSGMYQQYRIFDNALNSSLFEVKPIDTYIKYKKIGGPGSFDEPTAVLCSGVFWPLQSTFCTRRENEQNETLLLIF